MGELQLYVVDDRLAGVGQLAAVRHDVAGEMSRSEPVEQVDDAVGHQEPGHQEMPVAPGLEILIGRQRDPAREGPLDGFTAHVEEPQHAGGVDAVAQQGRIALLVSAALPGVDGEDGRGEL